MPARSEKQRRMMAIALHNPKKLYKRNRAVLKMGKVRLGHFTKKRKRRKVKRGRKGRK